MNRVVVFAAAFYTSISCGYAVELANTNIVGSTGLPGGSGVVYSDIANLSVTNSSLSGGGVTAQIDDSVVSTSYGGHGASLARVTDVSVVDTGLNGGDGGVVSVGGTVLSSALNAYGGRGFSFVGAGVSQNVLLSGVNSVGGNGGDVQANSASGQNISASGGIGVVIQNGSVEIRDSVVSGGDGGKIIAGNAGNSSGGAVGGGALFVVGNSLLSVDSESVFTGGNGGYYDNGTGIALASGGAGLGLTAVSTAFVVSNGTYVGGNGGIAEGAVGSSATGGSGISVRNSSNVTIESGVFQGGAGGILNGIRADDGASVHVENSSVSINGGSFEGMLLFTGTGSSTISIGDDVTGMLSDVYQAAGTVTVNDWNDSNFLDTTIADGSMIFVGQAFVLSGAFDLQASTASVDFSGGVTVKDGGTLNVGLGTVTTTDGVIESGASVITEYDGTSLGSVSASGDLTVNSGAKWTIDAGDNLVAVGKTFDLADASGTLTSGITAADVALLGNGAAGWLGSITDVQVLAGVLRATYGESDINVALGVAGDTTSEFGKAMADLTTIIPSGSAAYNNLKTLMSSQEEGGYVMTNSFARTPEVASSLINLQAVFADQILSRSRSKLRLDQVGYPVSVQPTGAAGWDAVRTFSDRVESGVHTDALRTFSDRVESSLGYDEVMSAVNGIVPDVSLDSTGIPLDWQTWGRGYGSSIAQDDVGGFSGYDATIAGAMVGIDKRMNNMLIGVGGGYALSILDGNSGNDGKAQTGNAVAYLSTHGDNAFFDASLSYALNSVETESSLLQYSGEFDAHTMGIYLGGGYSIAVMDNVLFIPEVSLLNTLYVREAYTASTSLAGLPNLNYDDYDQWSHLAKVGATLSMIQKIDFAKYELGIQPELRAYWMHEFNAEMDDETYRMDGGVYDIGASLQAREEDLVKVGAGLRFCKWASDELEFGVDVDGTVGDNYEAIVVSGKVIRRF